MRLFFYTYKKYINVAFNTIKNNLFIRAHGGTFENCVHASGHYNMKIMYTGVHKYCVKDEFGQVFFTEHVSTDVINNNII